MLELSILDAAMPPQPDPPGGEVEVWRDRDGVLCAYGYTVGRHAWMHLPDVASFSFDRDSNRVTAIPHASVRPAVIRDAYHRSVLPMILQAHHTEVLHASAVLAQHGVIALCATSGTGKSTHAAGLGRRGYRVWADDAVAVAASESGFDALPLPFTIRLRPSAAALFRGVPVTDAALHSDAAEMKLAPLAAVCVLERADGLRRAVKIERLRPAPAFPAVLAHAYCFSFRDLTRKRQMVQQYLDLTARVPVFAVRFESGLDKIPMILDAIERVINERP